MGDDDDRPPAYNTDSFYGHEGFGLPPTDVRKEDDAPVHEIHLDDADVDEGLGGEMVETGRGTMFGGTEREGGRDEKGQDDRW